MREPPRGAGLPALSDRSKKPAEDIAAIKLAFVFQFQESERQIPSMTAFDSFSVSARIWEVR